MAVATMWRGIGYARCDMTLQAPAIVDVRPIGTGAAAGIATWLRGIGVRQVRIATGLVLFAYIFSHFFNHALGNISYATMEAWLQYHIWFWRITVVNFVLYAAAITHAGLGLWALYQRRHFRYTFAEITQLALGLSIPLLIALHLAAVRLLGVLFDRPPSHYAGICSSTGSRAAVVRGAIRSAHRGLDPRLHRALFLAALETAFQMGSTIFARRGRVAAALAMLGANQDARSHAARSSAAMARRAS